MVRFSDIREKLLIVVQSVTCRGDISMLVRGDVSMLVEEGTDVVPGSMDKSRGNNMLT